MVVSDGKVFLFSSFQIWLLQKVLVCKGLCLGGCAFVDEIVNEKTLQAIGSH